jgi:hypothetical protein
MHLHAGDAEQAWVSYQDFLDVPEFTSSAEAYAAENMLEAYCSGNPDVIQAKASQGSCWRALDSSARLSTILLLLCLRTFRPSTCASLFKQIFHVQISKLARELPSKNCDLKAMSAFLNARMHEGEEQAEPEGGDGSDGFLT